MQLTDWLPTTRKEMDLRGWDVADIILFSGDAYVDHPSFGAAVIGRLLEYEGYRVCIVPQPDWHGDFRDFKKLGRPRMFSVLRPAVWILWLISIQPTGVCVLKTHIVLTAATICVRNTLLLYTPRFSNNFIPTCPLYLAALRRHSDV